MRRTIYALVGIVGLASSARAEDLTTQIQTLEKRIELRQPDLNRERDRNGRLKKELSGVSGGCWAEQRINTLEIIVNGSHQPNSNRLPGDSARQNVGNAGSMRFVLSESLQVVVENEEQMQIFGPNKSIKSQEFTSNLVRDITMLKVVKGGVAYATNSRQKTCGFLGLGMCTIYDNYETNIYSLGEITIKVNGQPLYKKSGIGYTFQGDNREWKDLSIKDNEIHKALMGVENCPTTN